MQVDDQQLITGIQKGDKKALRMLFDRYYKYVVGTVLKVSGDIELARDVAQELFFVLWKKRESLQINSSVKAYLRRAAINRMLNQIKAQRLIVSDPADLPDSITEADNPQQDLEAEDLHQIIYTAIDNLPEKCRVIFLLCRIEGLSHQEIATKLEISTKTIENQMTKALKSLRKAVAPYLSKDVLGWGIVWMCIGEVGKLFV